MGSLLRSVTLMDLSLSLNTSRVLIGRHRRQWLEKLVPLSPAAPVPWHHDFCSV
ncbi:hypothetical protein ACVSSM_08145 [Escherichia coli]